MADQMTPDELRADADTLEAHGKRHGDLAGDAPEPEFETALEAMRRLADVIEYAEDMYGGEGMGEWVVDIDAGEVWRIARGDATNHENRREMSEYVKLSEAPTLVFRVPECGTCYQECESDGDGWLCPSCGTSWGYDDYDQGGTLYENWSGETLGGEPAPPDADCFDDPQLKAKRAELQAAQNVRLWGCEHGLFCRGKCTTNHDNRSE